MLFLSGDVPDRFILFDNRVDAGRDLALCLEEYKGQNAIVIGLPRGGVVVAFEVAKALDLPLDVICPRKIGAPHNPELAIGAVTDSGQAIYNEPLIKALGVDPSYLKEATDRERKRAVDYRLKFRGNLLPRDLVGKIVILVDDGLATGATMKAALQSAKAEGADKVIVAVPVASIESVEDMDVLADDVIAVDTPPFFQAIGQFYEDFTQVDDEEVRKLLLEKT